MKSYYQPGGAADVVGVGADPDVDLVVGALRPHLDDRLFDAMVVVWTYKVLPLGSLYYS